MSFIYIMTNPAYPGYVKIGATQRDVESRRKELSSQTGVMFNFEIYATYQTKGNLQDKNFHRIIDKLNPTLRANKKREFYKMEPEAALDLLMAIAEIAGDTENVTKWVEDSSENDIKNKKSPFSFTSAGIKPGTYITFTENEDIKVKVLDDRKIEYNGKPTSLSDLARKLLDLKHPVQGTLYFSYDNETLNERRERLEKEGKYINV